MASVAKAIIIGNLTRDPELRFLANQTAVCNFTVACNHKYTSNGEKREEVAFIDCVAWGKGGELINQYVKKGNPLYIDGRIRQESWEDKNGGGKRRKLTVVVDSFQFLGGNRSEQGDAPYGEDQRPQPQRPAARPNRPTSAPVENPIGDEQAFTDSEIPF